MNRATIFDIQRFSINDGPGIRTTVFFKGCSLKCRWCHNPESIHPKEQLSYNPQKCIMCERCIEYLKGDGIHIENGGLIIDFNKHNYSFELINICPSGALSKYGNLYTIDEVIDIILKDIDYYENSNGGVTLSGGEAINQIEFLSELGLKLKKKGIHICLDVSGFDPKGLIGSTTDFVDTYLLDYKLTSLADHVPYIGKQLTFDKVIQTLADNEQNIILRCPIIKGVNDNHEHFKAIVELEKKYKNIEYVDILPYHNMVKAIRFKFYNEPTLYDVPSEEEKLIWKSKLLALGLQKGYMESKKF